MKKEIAESYEKIFKLESLILEQAAQGQITCGLEMQMRIETSNYLLHFIFFAVIILIIYYRIFKKKWNNFLLLFLTVISSMKILK